MPIYSNKEQKQAELRAILKAAGIIPTQQRMDIARVVLCRHQHLSADQILDRVKNHGGTASKATIYNTLGLFVKKGVIREVLVDSDRLFFDSNTDDHCHMYNEDTGELTDIYADFPQACTMPGLPAGTELVGIDIIFRVRQTD